MAPVLKRVRMLSTGSTSSSGTGAPFGEKPMRSRRVTARPGRCTQAENSLNSS